MLRIGKMQKLKPKKKLKLEKCKQIGTKNKKSKNLSLKNTKKYLKPYLKC